MGLSQIQHRWLITSEYFEGKGLRIAQGMRFGEAEDDCEKDDRGIYLDNLNSQNPAVRDAQTQRAYVKVHTRTPHMQVHLGSIQIIFLTKQVKLRVYVFETPCLQTAQIPATCRSPASNSPRITQSTDLKKQKWSSC